MKGFPLIVWILIVSVFFSRGTFFMVWPFLAILLYDTFGLSEWEVGALITSSTLCSIFVGFYCGALTDSVGRKPMLIFAGLFSCISFGFLAIVSEIYEYAICMACCAASKEVWEPPAKAMLSDMLPNIEQREFAFQLRYWMVNAGVAVGPFIGLAYGLTAQQSTFFVTSAVFIAITLIISWAFVKSNYVETFRKSESVNARQIFNVLKNDNVLFLLVLSNILIVFVYAHMDTSLVQYLSKSEVPEVLELISTLLLVNALTIIFLQFAALKMMQSWKLIERIYLGVFFVAISQIGLAVNPIDWFWGWLGSIFILSIGECILFPSMNIYLDRIAPSKMKGLYFGVATLYSVGFVFAPLVGGVILDLFNGTTLFSLTFLICLLVGYLYLRLQRKVAIS